MTRFVEGWIEVLRRLRPAATPAAIVNRLNETLVKVVRMPDVVAALEAQGWRATFFVLGEMVERDPNLELSVL